MDDCPREAILQRLRKIEGQVKGIQKMVEDGKKCADILVQVAAVRAAVNKVGALIFENHTRDCLKSAVKCEQQEDTVEELVRMMGKFTTTGES